MISRKVCLLAGFLIYSAVALAADGPLALKDSSGEEARYEPGRVVVRPLVIHYGGDSPVEVRVETGFPEGWKPLGWEETISFAGPGTEVLLLGFHLPGNTSAGMYSVTVSVTGDDISARLELPVEVLPVVSVDCALLEQPDYVIAGEAYRAVFACSNRGNVPVSAAVKAISRSGFDVRTEADRIALLPGETVRLAVVTATPINLYTQLRHLLQLTLNVEEDDSAEASATSSVDIIPRTTGRESRYNTIVGEVSTRGVLQHGVSDLFGLEAEVSGQGFLDEDNETYLLFRLKDALAGAGTLIPDREEYIIKAEGRNYSAGLGTQFYSLSPLTEASVYGTGVSLSRTFGNLGLSGFAMDQLLDGQNGSRVASRLSYRFGDRGTAAFNLLDAREDGRWTSAGLQGYFLTPAGDRIETEYASSRTGTLADEAFYTSAGGSTDTFAYSIKYLKAGPYYRGSLEDQEQFIASVGYHPARFLRLRAGAGRKSYDLNNTIPGKVVSSQLGFSWSGFQDTLLTADIFRKTETDYEPTPAEKTAAESFKIGFLWNRDPVNLRVSYEFGNGLSTVDTVRTYSEHLLTKLDIISDPLGDLGASLGYYFSDFSSTQTPYSDFSLTWKKDLGSRAVLSAEYRTVNSRQSYFEGSDTLALALDLLFPNQSELVVKAEYGPDRRTGNPEDIKVILAYKLPFPIPVSLKKNIGRIQGKVVDAVAGQAVPEVILRLGDAVAVTDSFGRYSFHSLAPGVHRLYIDPASLPADYIPAEPMPLEVEISGTEAERHLRLTKAAYVSGRVVMYRFDRNYRWLGGDKGAAYVDPRGVSGILLTVKGSKGFRRALTGENGEFVFPPLEPDTWSLKVPESIVPEGHFLAKDEFELVMEPGGREDIIIKIFPKIRQIRFIDEGTIMEETSTEDETPEESTDESPDGPPGAPSDEVPEVIEEEPQVETAE